jgi:hypothetical protein
MDYKPIPLGVSFFQTDWNNEPLCFIIVEIAPNGFNWCHLHAISNNLTSNRPVFLPNALANRLFFKSKKLSTEWKAFHWSNY